MIGHGNAEPLQVVFVAESLDRRMNRIFPKSIHSNTKIHLALVPTCTLSFRLGSSFLFLVFAFFECFFQRWVLFWCQARVDHVVKHEDMIRRMSEVGLAGLFLGFESGSDRVLRFIRKGTTRAKNLEAARICRKYGIRIWANYMLGLPTETKEEIKETISMLKEIDPDYYSPAYYTPYPGNDLYDYCIEHGLSLVEPAQNARINGIGGRIQLLDHTLRSCVLALRQSLRYLRAIVPIAGNRGTTGRHWSHRGQ